MIFVKDFEISSSKVDINEEIINKGIMEILEDTATRHAESIGDGLTDREKRGTGWVVVDWKIKVIKRPKYNQTLNVLTWGREEKKCYIYRDFEIYNDENELCVIATSKWVILNLKNRKIGRISEELLKAYNPEVGVSVFDNEKLNKIKEPPNYQSSIKYQVKRRDIDLNNHMHNVYYLDMAYEALPEEVYKNKNFDNIRIMYKKEIKLNDIIECKYTHLKDKDIVGIYSENGEILHSIVEFY